MQAVYRIMPVLDDPHYATLSLIDNSPIASGVTLLSDFVPPDVSSKNWQAPRLANLWKRRKVKNHLPFQVNDYPCIGLRIPAFSNRAKEELASYLVPNGELLELDCDEGSFVAYNPTVVSHALDRERSDIVWPDRERLKIRKGEAVDLVYAATINRHVFDPEGLNGLSIFRIAEDIVRYYVTQEFVDAVNEAGLKGFNFELMWESTA